MDEFEVELSLESKTNVGKVIKSACYAVQSQHKKKFTGDAVVLLEPIGDENTVINLAEFKITAALSDILNGLPPTQKFKARVMTKQHALAKGYHSVLKVTGLQISQFESLLKSDLGVTQNGDQLSVISAGVMGISNTNQYSDFKFFKSPVSITQAPAITQVSEEKKEKVAASSFEIKEQIQEVKTQSITQDTVETTRATLPDSLPPRILVSESSSSSNPSVSTSSSLSLPDDTVVSPSIPSTVKITERAKIVFVSDYFNGYGDFFFALKLTQNLSQAAAKRGSSDPVYLVTQQSGREKIKEVEGDTEFKVTVISLEEFHAIREQHAVIIDQCFIGPVFHPDAHKLLKLDSNTPIILMPEYSIGKAKSVIYSKLQFARLKHKVRVISTGLKDKKENGIFISPELRKTTESKIDEYREKHWSQFSSQFISLMHGEKDISAYHTATILGFEYSFNDFDGETPSEYHANHCQHYLLVLLSCYQDSNQDMDVISVGKNKTAKQEALTAVLPILKSQGYSKVLFVDLENGGEVTSIWQDESTTDEPDRIFRMIYAPQIIHKQMTAFIGLSPIVGVTGDQTVGEALSATNILVVECLAHKLELINNFLDLLTLYSENPQVVKFQKQLLMADLTNHEARAELKSLFTTAGPDYIAACQHIALNHDLTTIVSQVDNFQAGREIAATQMVRRPDQLSLEEIERYRVLASKTPRDAKKLIKVSRKSETLKEYKLPFSVLLYPNNAGFYLVDGPGAILGLGGWGKVKACYYFDEKGIPNKEALVVKIQAPRKNAAIEIGLFAKMHAKDNKDLFRYGVRQQDTDAVDEEEKSYGILPFILGVPLDQFLRENPQLSVSERIGLAIAVMSQLEELHVKMGVAHLDLKIQNIMYNASTKQLYLMDYGCAMKFGATLETIDLYMSHYIPPDGLSATQPVNGGIDIYSSVIVMCHILQIPLESVMTVKLETALTRVKNPTTRDAIRKAFKENINTVNCDGFLYNLAALYGNEHSDFNRFINSFSQISELNFDVTALNTCLKNEELAGTVQELFVDMSHNDPGERPSAAVAKSTLQSSLSLISEVTLEI